MAKRRGKPTAKSRAGWTVVVVAFLVFFALVYLDIISKRNSADSDERILAWMGIVCPFLSVGGLIAWGVIAWRQRQRDRL